MKLAAVPAVYGLRALSPMDAGLFTEYAAAFQAHVPACFAVEKAKLAALAATGCIGGPAVPAWLAANLDTGRPG